MREHAATSPPNNQSIQKYQHVNPSQAHESTQQHGSPQASHAAAENQVGTPDVKPVVSPVGILSAKAALGASDVSAASALGYGGPSDWEHFGSSVADEVDDTELFSRKGNPAQMIANDNVELLSQPAPSRPENKDSQSSPFFAELEQGTPSSAHLPLQPHLGPLPTSPSVAQNNSAPLFAATSAATPPSDNQLAPERSGPIERVGDSASGSPAQSQYQTIDEAIHIWSEPSKVSTKEGSLEQIAPGMAKQSDAVEYENHSPQQPSGQLETLDPPRPEGLVHSSMQHTTKNETRSEERQVGVIEEVGASGLVQQHLPVRDSSKANPLEHIVDLAHQRAHDSEDAYSDLDPWAKASLNRYTGMLRAEASATTDASKLQIFEAFMAKESLLRAVLYGASPEITFNTITRLGQPSSSVTKPADLDRHTEDGRTTASPQAEPRPSTPANAPSQQRATPLSPPKEQSASVETGNSCVRTPSPMANPAVPQGEPLTHLVEVPLLNDISRPEQPKMPLSPQIQEQSTSRREKSTSPIEAVPLEKQPALQGHFLTTVAVPSSAQSSETDLREEEQPTLKLATTGSYAETNLEDDIQYSPGGRPIVPRPDREQPRDQKVAAQSSQHPVSHQQVTKRECGGQKYDGRPSSPGADAPIVVTATWDNTSARLPRSTSVPPGLDSGVQRSSSQGYQEVATTRPAYTPFRYIQDSSPDSGHPSSSQSYYKAYSAPRQTSVDSGMSLRNKSAIQTRRGTLDSASASRREHNDTLVENRKVFWDSGKIINGKTNLPEVNENIPESQATILGGRPGSPRTAFQHPGAHEVSTVHEAIATLKRTLPASRGQVPTLANNPQVDAAKHDVDNVHDDFTFIKKTVVAWDAEAKKIRALHEKERRVRQEQSEERIDGLFHDDEIGYSDIGVLEAEFKTAEAEKRALEEEEEQNSFLRSVFHVVTNKIQEEIDHLSGQYNMLMSLLIHAVTCKTTLDLDEDRPEITQVLEVILIIHSKLEIRHKKIFEALLEKDRRSRKTRLAPLYTEGRITEMKQLEKEYEKIEREATLEAARKRDGRANELIEAIDEHTIRGIKENQDCIRVLSREIRTIDEAISVGSRIDDLNELHADLTFARTLLTYLLANSTRLMQQSHSADGILNDADYDVSVAEARLANADAKTFERLGEEKDGEDAKLKVELEQRCSTVKEDFGVADQLADALIARLKDVDSEDKGRVGTPVPGHSDPEHEDRIKRALDEAKKRNADKQAGFEIMS